jgi:hypothetical protein
MKKLLLLSLFIFFIMSAIISCTQSNGSEVAGNSQIQPASPWLIDRNAVGKPSSLIIGVSGGSLDSPDGRFKVVIPAGALSTDTLIKIQQYINDDYEDGSTGLIYTLLPDGQTFQIPVQISYSYSDEELDGTSADGLGIIYRTSDNIWQWIDDPVIDSTLKTVTINSDHFTDWKTMKGFGFYLKPKSAVSVKVGQKVSLQVAYSLKGGPPGNTVITGWEVNGEAGGDPAIGTVSPTSMDILQTAEYTAPATKPTPNRVWVFANIKIGTKTATIAKTIYIFDAPAYFGEVKFWGWNESGTSSYVWNGWGLLYFNQDTVEPDFYNLDEINSRVIFDSYTVFGQSEDRQDLVSPAHQIYSIKGKLGIQNQNKKYGFLVNANVNGKLRSGTSIEDTILQTLITSYAHDTTGFKDLGDGKNLKGEQEYTVYMSPDNKMPYDVISEWNFNKVE